MKSPEFNRPAAQGGIKLHDILYILFKHKWKILIPTVLGFVAAGFIAFRSDSMAPSFQTQADLLVRYVVERNASDPDAPSSVKGAGPMEVMNTELQILKSFNVALDTVEKLGPKNVMDAGGQAPTKVAAATYLSEHFSTTAERGSNIIQLSYRDKDPKRAVTVLTQIIQCYFTRHLEIHRSNTVFDEVSAQADQARSTLRVTQEEINQLKAKSGVVTLEGTITDFESRRQLIRANIMASQEAVGGQRAKVAAMEKAPTAAAKNGPDAESDATVKMPVNAEEKASQRKTAEALAEYKDLTSTIEQMSEIRRGIVARRSASDPGALNLESKIAAAQARKFELANQYPDFNRRVEAANGQIMMAPVVTLEDEQALLAALEARLTMNLEQAKKIEDEVASLSSLGFKLAELEDRRVVEEEKFRTLQSRVEEARVDEALDPTRMPNIGIVQDPSSPVKSIDSTTKKIIIGIAASGMMLGLGLAFLIEMVLDRRITRPGQIRTRLQMPLMLSIPYARSKDGVSQLIGSTDPLNPPPLPDSRLALGNNGALKLHASGPAHFIEPYTAAIHDRILFNFEINNITHKPKLIALTGLSQGAGSTTIATGLAKSFADGGNRKVLLVDLNPSSNGGGTNGHGSQSLRHALDISRTEQFRQSPRNLYFASASTRRFQGESSALAPLGLREILPNLVASDYDYIIFDMPPVDATSPTVAMAGFMDKVLLVLDAEGTTPDRLEWAYSELQKGRADVSCILNKVKSHAPRWVQGDM
jgi:succinoglycan biosynthesis transport protein ExoP